MEKSTYSRFAPGVSGKSTGKTPGFGPRMEQGLYFFIIDVPDGDWLIIFEQIMK